MKEHETLEDACQETGSKRPPWTREQVGAKCLAFLAEHDGSEELYQMLHGKLGLTNAEIESLGFNLIHRFEEERIAGPETQCEESGTRDVNPELRP
ncbi:hypothetical protein [Anaerotruncus rubiinfantis]|uniref:hypothetical protein n=1 Tax=Anaerotruncus rubiinfantis TaxID=1720200 RepID=UPI000830F03A|nr:hypothetical protein [Anaerotruncus rubiinfantis]